MAEEVTDPELLRQLNGPEEVTDPELLKQLNAPAQTQDFSGEASPWSGLEDRTPEAESLKISKEYKGPSHALQHGSDYSLESMASGAPVLGALVPQTPELQAWEKAHPGKATAMHVAGSVLGIAPAMVAAPEFMGAGAAQGLGARTAAGMLSSGLIGEADALARGDDPMQAAKKAGISAATAGLATPVASAIGAAVGPTIQKGAAEAQKLGIRLTGGQNLGGTAQSVENVLNSVPFVRSGVSKQRLNSIKDYNRAAINDSLDKIGTKLPDDVDPGAEGRKWAYKAIDDVYDTAKANSKLTANPVQSQFVNDIDATRANAIARDSILTDQQGPLNNAVRLIKEKLNAGNGVLDGKTIKEIDSYLGSEATRFTNSNSPWDQNVGRGLADLNDTFMKHVKDQNPLMAQKIEAADAAYVPYKRVEKAGTYTRSKDSDVEGYFMPAQLEKAYKDFDPSKDKRLTSFQDNGMNPDLRLAGNIIPNKMPDSGSPERLEWAVTAEALMALAGHPYAALPVLGPPIAGRMLYSDPGQTLARALINSGQSVRQPVAQATRSAGPQLARALMSQYQNQGNPQ